MEVINMEILNWIDRPISEIKKTPLYHKYFNNIKQETGTDVFTLFNPLFGIDMILTTGQKIKSIHFYNEEIEDAIKRFPDELPFKLNFGSYRAQTQELLGQPAKSGGGDFSFLYGTVPPWDKYFFKNFSLHIQFLENKETINLITIDSLAE